MSFDTAKILRRCARPIVVPVCCTITIVTLSHILAEELPAQTRPYDEVVPSSAQTDEGLFDVHRVGDQLLFEIPDTMLNRDMIVMSRLQRTNGPGPGKLWT